MYKQIFEEIVDIIHQDYAGCEDKRGWDDPEKYREKIYNQNLTAHEFVELVEEYIADLKDPHMFFRLIGEEKALDIGFKVRRFENALYVTELYGETRLETGDRIVALDQLRINEIFEIHRKYLYDKPSERENWLPVLNKYNEATIEKSNGDLQQVRIQRYVKADYKPEYSLKQLKPDTSYIKMTDFLNPDSINQLIQKHEHELNTSDYLIVDVRKNLGGSDSAFQALIPYLFPEGKTKLDLAKNYTQLFNATDRSSDLTIRSVQEFMSDVEDPQVKKNAQSFIDTWKKYRGKGFVVFDQDLNPEPELIEGKSNPKKVVVLSDVYCGSAGDVFVELCKFSNKVTVIGRGTAGVNDYSNLARMRWDNQFELLYATSKLTRVDEGKGMTGIGILPDVYIPWTPDHLTRDVDLEHALDLFYQKSFPSN